MMATKLKVMAAPSAKVKAISCNLTLYIFVELDFFEAICIDMCISSPVAL